MVIASRHEQTLAGKNCTAGSENFLPSSFSPADGPGRRLHSSRELRQRLCQHVDLTLLRRLTPGRGGTIRNLPLPGQLQAMGWVDRQLDACR